MNTAQTPSSLDRWSGACWVAAGLLLLIGMFHPNFARLDQTPATCWRSS